MKTRKKLNCSIKSISIMILLMIILSETTNGDDPNGKYIRRESQMMKTQSPAREVRGIRPGNLQTARDFGKRNDRFLELGNFHRDRHSRRYPSYWFLERVQRDPRIKRILLNSDDREDLKTRLLLETIKFP